MNGVSSDVTRELNLRLQADMAGMEKFYQYFGLKLTQRFGLTDLKELFPDTPVSVLKKCFEALRMYDLAEIMAKVKSRSLRPALSPEQIEKLWRAGDRPTKYHINVSVLLLDFTLEGDIGERNETKKIETFFKDLNSRNKVTIISLASSKETREVLRKIKVRNREMAAGGDRCRELLEGTLHAKALAEKELEEVKETKKGPKRRRILQLEQREVMLRGKLEQKKQTERDFEKLKELEKESKKRVSTAMDEWIHNQGWLTLYTYLHVYSN